MAAQRAAVARFPARERGGAGVIRRMFTGILEALSDWLGGIWRRFAVMPEPRMLPAARICTSRRRVRWGEPSPRAHRSPCCCHQQNFVTDFEHSSTSPPAIFVTLRHRGRRGGGKVRNRPRADRGCLPASDPYASVCGRPTPTFKVTGLARLYAQGPVDRRVERYTSYRHKLTFLECLKVQRE